MTHSPDHLKAAAKVLVLVPVIEPLDIRTCWEHTPLDYYRYGEYPRFLRPIGAHRPRTRLAACAAVKGE